MPEKEKVFQLFERKQEKTWYQQAMGGIAQVGCVVVCLGLLLVLSLSIAYAVTSIWGAL